MCARVYNYPDLTKHSEHFIQLLTQLDLSDRQLPIWIEYVYIIEQAAFVSLPVWRRSENELPEEPHNPLDFPIDPV